MKLIFLGPPGSGKGTQAAIISEKLGIPKIATGDMFREEIKKGTPLGTQAKQFLDAGTLVPDGITVAILKARLQHSDCHNGFILDGFPRTIAQAHALDEITPVDLVINFIVSEQTIIDRMTNRLTCTACQAVYNKKSKPPRHEGVCDICGGAVSQRSDETAEAMKMRLAVYHQQTRPLIAFYQKRHLLAPIDAEQAIGQTTQQIFKRLDQLHAT